MGDKGEERPLLALGEGEGDLRGVVLLFFVCSSLVSPVGYKLLTLLALEVYRTELFLREELALKVARLG